jgi:hypothetical protein
MVQNATSVFGRTLPNVLTDKIGMINVLILVSFGAGILIFAMLGITWNAGGVIAFSILYGFFSGAGQPLQLVDCHSDTETPFAVLSLLLPAIASFSRSVNEVG